MKDAKQNLSWMLRFYKHVKIPTFKQKWASIFLHFKLEKHLHAVENTHNFFNSGLDVDHVVR